MTRERIKAIIQQAWDDYPLSKQWGEFKNDVADRILRLKWEEYTLAKQKLLQLCENLLEIAELLDKYRAQLNESKKLKQ